MTADVIVVGFGAAGAAAAIEAADAGARVLVLEATEAGGGNCRYSAGFLFDAPQPALVDHLEALCFGRTPRDVLQAYADGLNALEAWMADVGIPCAPFHPPPGRFPASLPAWPSFPSGHTLTYRFAAGGEGSRGRRLWEGLEAAVAERDVEVRHDARVRELLLEDGAVVGVVTDAGPVRAAGGVVLTCGGFEGDAELADEYLALAPILPLGHQGNRGDAVHLGRQAGASLWHMHVVFGWFALRVEGFDAPFPIDVFGPGHLLVDADGRRFCDEVGFEAHDRLRALDAYQPHRPNRPRLPSHLVLDQATLDAGPLSGQHGLLGTPNDHVWSADNREEVQRGWIVRAEDPAGLAAALDLPALEGTLAEYGAAVEAGHDPLFARDPETLVALEGPLYALTVWPGVAGTVGGPRHDPAGRVLRPDRSPIDGLYVAGAASLVYGHLIDFGGGLTDAMVFGRLAGADAAARAAGAVGTTTAGAA